ncbi:hypothetical protein LM602_05655 [Candidatus Acetothermia bacterium]|jgi:hypothetical protein|nr:hypothetical protein [Candidatus Acetothermia bacterium]MCI2432027.1 hypothetical protein [Candidatus Acetothermia bacterium]MCI2436003.1 hypothetical protein [Candidatus Acetothermia bacterium]
MSSSPNAKEPEWLSPELEALAYEIALLNEKYVEAVADLQEQVSGSEHFLQRWAELDVLLEWLQKKVVAAREEIVRIEETWD